MAFSNQQKLFYDISAIKQIPILSVAEQMGIAVQKCGKNFWCKVRDEEKPSVVLHPDRNSFYDFGKQEHGDVIHFVQYAQDISAGAAIRYLGETFGLEPCMTRQELIDRPLTDWEYSRIGLHGDLATKNLVFPIETASLDDLCEMSMAYQKSLNALCKEDPEVYRDIIQKTAVPYIETLRSNYYLSVWNYFHLTFLMGDNSIQLYRSSRLRERFRSDTAALNRAEHILYRAQRNAGLAPSEPPHHDPVNVVRQLLHGDLTISLGNTDKEGIASLAKTSGCKVCEASLPFDAYFDDNLLRFPHAATYQAGQVTVYYLSADQRDIHPILGKIQQQSNPPLEQLIAVSAQKRKSMELQKTHGENHSEKVNIPQKEELSF